MGSEDNEDGPKKKKKNTFAIDITIETCEKRLELMLLGSSLLL